MKKKKHMANLMAVIISFELNESISKRRVWGIPFEVFTSEHFENERYDRQARILLVVQKERCI